MKVKYQKKTPFSVTTLTIEEGKREGVFSITRVVESPDGNRLMSFMSTARANASLVSQYVQEAKREGLRKI